MEPSRHKGCPRAAGGGRIIRYVLLIVLIVAASYLAFYGVTESRDVYVCDVPEDETTTPSVLRECSSLDDTTSCLGLFDEYDNESKCVLSSCGYKLLPHVDVSVSGSSDPLDPNASTSTLSFLSIISIFYGIVPYLVGLMYMAYFLATGHISALTRFVVWGMIATSNEVIFKNIFDQRRPVGSCLYFESYGMPSGHAATSVGLLTYLLLELFVYHPNIMCGIACRKSREDRAFVRGYGWRAVPPSSGDGNDDGAISDAPSGLVVVRIHDDYAIEEGGVEDIPESSSSMVPPNRMGRWAQHIHALCYVLLLLPVPFSRVYLHDHTRDQVLAGSGLGIIISTVWYTCFVRNCGYELMNGWGRTNCGMWWGLKFSAVGVS